MLERHPAGSDIDRAVPLRIDLQRIGAAEIDGGRRWRLDEEFAGWRPDECVHRTARQGKPVIAGSCIEQLHAGVRIDLDQSDVANTTVARAS